jgi:xanthine dehydrogenase YagR molybdenum-binding subunit
MSSSVIGQPVTRIDGRLKVTGGAAYAVEHPIPNVVHGVGVASTIAKGRIVRLDSTAAEKMRGYWRCSITAIWRICIAQQGRL